MGAGVAAALLWPRPAPPLAVSTPTARPTPSPAPPLVVHVLGAVGSPGVYQLPSGSRVEEAVRLAGGLSEDADAGSVNLAARLVDGQQLVVRSRSQPSADAKAGGKLNINAATLADLDALPGVGPVLAQRIFERRQRLGLFERIEQLRDERLLPNATYERIKDLISVS